MSEWASPLQPLASLLVGTFDRVQRQLLVGFEALRARVSRQELHPGIRERPAAQERQPLVPEQLGGDDLAQPGGFPVALRHVLRAPPCIRPAALCLDDNRCFGWAARCPRHTGSLVQNAQPIKGKCDQDRVPAQRGAISVGCEPLTAIAGALRT